MSDYKVMKIGTMSNRSGLILLAQFRCDWTIKKMLKWRTKWEKLIHDNMKEVFNNKLRKYKNKDESINEFCKAIVNAGKTVLAEDDEVDQGWCDLSKDNLRPMIEYRNNLLFKARNLNMQNPSLK